MTPLVTGLAPSPADLLQALRFAVVVILTCGFGFLAGARRIETAIFTGWGIACIVFVTAGCIGGLALAPAAAFFAAAGTVGLVNRFWFGGEQGSMALRVLVLGAPTMLILLSLRSTAYDDFSFWAPNLVALSVTGHFPVAAHPLTASFMPGYPRGVALSGYATYLLGPDPSPAGLLRLLATGAWWNILLMLAVAASLARILASRLHEQGAKIDSWMLWGLAGLAILLQSFLNPGFISKMTMTNMGDAATGSGLAMLTALLFELPEPGLSARLKARIVAEMAFTGAAVVFVRQDNLALLAIFALGAGFGLLLWGGTGFLRRTGWLVIAALPTLLVSLTWTHYAGMQIPGGAHSVLPVKDWHWAAYPDTLYAAGKVLLSKGIYTLLAIGFAAAFLATLAGRGLADPSKKILLTATTMLIFGNAAFIMLTYLATSFTQVEVRTAVTFWRFLAQTAAAEMVTLACLAPLPALGWGKRLKPVWLAFSLVAAFLPVALLDTPFTFRTDLRFPVQDFLGIGQSLALLLPANASLLLLDNSDGSGYVAWMIKFGLLELGGANNPVSISLAPQLAASQASPGVVPKGSYVLVTQSEWRPPYFPNANMQPWHAYLFQSEDSGLVLLKDWPIPRYGRKY